MKNFRGLNKVTFTLTMLFSCSDSLIQAQTETTKPLHPAVSYIGEGAENFHGGIKRGIAYAALKNFVKKGETAFELTYQYCFNEHFILQPDLQYILHPAGTEETINNTFVGFLRFYVNF